MKEPVEFPAETQALLRELGMKYVPEREQYEGAHKWVLSIKLTDEYHHDVYYDDDPTLDCAVYEVLVYQEPRTTSHGGLLVSALDAKAVLEWFRFSGFPVQSTLRITRLKALIA